MNKIHQSLLIITLIIAGTFFGNSSFAREKRDTLKVLFVGNSYTEQTLRENGMLK